VKNVTKGTSFTVTHALTERAGRVMLAGGMLNYVKQQVRASGSA